MHIQMQDVVSEMQEALQAVQQGGIIRSVAKRCEVARSILYDHVSGKVKEGDLQPAEGEELVSCFMCYWLWSHTATGFSIRASIIDSKGNQSVTREW